MTDPTVPDPPEQPAGDPEDKRQLWVCVDPYGPRTKGADGEPEPPFRSDVHLTGERVQCPNCGNYTVQRAEVADAMAARFPTSPPSNDPRLAGRR